MFSNEIKQIIERADSSEESAYLICYWLTTKPGVDPSVLFQGDGQLQHLLAEASDEMRQRIQSFGLS
jgi:hypothetical protein